jgi:hypothetical protein
MSPESPPVETSPAETSPVETGPIETAAAETPAAPVSTEINTAPTLAIGHTGRAAWILGSKLSLAALANDRGIAPEDVPKWFEEAQAAAAALNVQIIPLPERAESQNSEPASKAVLGYVLDQEKTISKQLASSVGDQDAAVFQLAMRSNLLLLLNSPGSKAVETISKSVAALGPRTGLPAELWQPLLDTLAQGATPADVRTQVRQMHTDIGRHLAESEQ